MSAYVQVWACDGWSFESGSLLFGDDVRITPPGQPVECARWWRDLAAAMVAEAERLEEYHQQALKDLAAARADSEASTPIRHGGTPVTVLDELEAALAAAEQDLPQRCGHSSDPMCCPFENLPELATWFTAAERERLVNAVRAVHHNGTDPWAGGDPLAPGKWCVADGDEWPCATMRALAGEVAQ